MTNGRNEMKETWELWSMAEMKCKKLGWLKPCSFTCHIKYSKTIETWNNLMNDKMDPRTWHKWNPKTWLQVEMEIMQKLQTLQMSKWNTTS